MSRTKDRLLENLNAQSEERGKKVTGVITGSVASDSGEPPVRPGHPSQPDSVAGTSAMDHAPSRLGRPSLGIAKEKLTVALLPDTKQQIKLQAVMNHTTPGHIIEQAMAAWMASQAHTLSDL